MFLTFFSKMLSHKLVQPRREKRLVAEKIVCWDAMPYIAQYKIALTANFVLSRDTLSMSTQQRNIATFAHRSRMKSFCSEIVWSVNFIIVLLDYFQTFSKFFQILLFFLACYEIEHRNNTISMTPLASTWKKFNFLLREQSSEV